MKVKNIIEVIKSQCSTMKNISDNNILLQNDITSDALKGIHNKLLENYIRSNEELIKFYEKNMITSSCDHAASEEEIAQDFF